MKMIPTREMHQVDDPKPGFPGLRKLGKMSWAKLGRSSRKAQILRCANPGCKVCKGRG